MSFLEMTVPEITRRVGWAALGLFCLAWLWPSAGHTRSGQNPADSPLSSQVCQSCHAEIYESYEDVAMARSFYRPTPDNVIEDYTRENHFHHAPSNRQYRMVQRDGRFYQRRYRLDSGGKEKNVLEREVDWIIGSGEHARSYLSLDEGGVLRQLPVTWYPQIQRWGMSPGYDHPDHEDFGRQVTHSCLFCHNGYPLFPEPSDRYGQRNVFRTELPSGIGCHRCHGPGADHVKLASTGEAAAEQIRQSIVNPARLSAERQLDVCLQCHLEAAAAAPRFRRSGRPVYSFRPGDALADYIVHFDLGEPDAKNPPDRFEIDSAGYRMRQSACFRLSRGAMTCTTCHDPHRKLRGEEALSHYRERCLTCHNQPSTAVHGETPPGDCTACHMPKRRAQDVVHAVMTDHLIQKGPPGPNLLAPLQEDHSPKKEQPLLYFPLSLSGWERDLYLGMAEVQTPGNLRQGLDRLTATLKRKSAPFAEPYVKLAMAQAETGAHDAARASLERALGIDPESPIAHFNLAEAMRRQGQYAAAIEQYRRTLALDPSYAKAHLGLGLVNRQQGRPAVESFRRALQSDPLLAEAHLGLGRVSLEKRRAAEAARHFLQALRVDPDRVEAHLNLGLAQARQGLQEEAVEAFRQA
ncbi:MAG: tetratricopeptide repeat protein, partial [Acidobacteriota bacterium]|nr:tetratricopeptide repeat protein [Acidobacteriota bacterium]